MPLPVLSACPENPCNHIMPSSSPPLAFDTHNRQERLRYSQSGTLCFSKIKALSPDRWKPAAEAPRLEHSLHQLHPASRLSHPGACSHHCRTWELEWQSESLMHNQAAGKPSHMSSCLSQSNHLFRSRPSRQVRKPHQPGIHQFLPTQQQLTTALQQAQLLCRQAGRVLTLLLVSRLLITLLMATPKQAHVGGLAVNSRMRHCRSRLLLIPSIICTTSSRITAGSSMSSSTLPVACRPALLGAARAKGWGMLPLPTGITLSSMLNPWPVVGLSKELALLVAGPSRVRLGLAVRVMVSSLKAGMQDREVMRDGNFSPLGPPMGGHDWRHDFEAIQGSRLQSVVC